jgi:hypothetical protein
LPAGNLTEVPAEARGRIDFTRRVVEAATSRAPSGAWTSVVRCVARAERKVCRERIQVARPERDTIEWSCAKCGERGTITGFAGSERDLSGFIPTVKTYLWGVTQESHDLLYAATEDIPELRAVISRASPVDEIPGFLRIDATMRELDDLYTLVEELTDATRSRRRIEILGDLRGDLCAVMDSDYL